MKVRKSLGAFALAAAAIGVAAGCSSSTDTVSEATSKASTAIESAVGEATNAVIGLQNSDAQAIIRKAVDPATGITEIDAVVDHISSDAGSDGVAAFSGRR